MGTSPKTSLVVLWCASSALASACAVEGVDDAVGTDVAQQEEEELGSAEASLYGNPGVYLSGPIKYGNNRSLCLTRNGGSEGNGTAAIVETCNGGAAQDWNYYFRI